MSTKQMLVELLECRICRSSYWVSSAGSDSAPGSANAPWATLQKAFDSVRAGDTVTVRAGSYAGASAFTMRGTATAPIRFLAEGNVRITAKAANQTALNVGIEISGFDVGGGASRYVSFDGFTVDNAGGSINGPLSSGFRVRFADHISLTRCTVRNVGWVGFYSAYVHNFTIDRCTSADNNGFTDSGTARNHGIYVAQDSADIVIRNCTVSGNRGNGIHLNGDGFTLRRATVEGNTIIGNGAIGGSAINCDGVHDSTFQRNILWLNHNKGIALYGADGLDYSKNNRVAGNIIVQATDNAALQIKEFCSATVSGNALVNRSGAAIERDASATGTIAANGYAGRLDGQSKGTNWITPRGDANWDGSVTGDDYCVVDAAQGGSVFGDLNLDVKVTKEDYLPIQSNLSALGGGGIGGGGG